MPRLGKRRRWALAIIFVYALMIAIWSVRPLHESMPVGTDYSPTVLDPPQPEKAARQEVECNNLWASSPGPSEPLPALTPQPEGKPPLAYGRPPCEFVQRDARKSLAIDVVFILGALSVVLFVGTRRSSHATTPDPKLAVAGAA